MGPGETGLADAQTSWVPGFELSETPQAPELRGLETLKQGVDWRGLERPLPASGRGHLFVGQGPRTGHKCRVGGEKREDGHDRRLDLFGSSLRQDCVFIRLEKDLGFNICNNYVASH